MPPSDQTPRPDDATSFNRDTVGAQEPQKLVRQFSTSEIDFIIGIARSVLGSERKPDPDCVTNCMRDCERGGAPPPMCLDLCNGACQP